MQGLGRVGNRRGVCVCVCEFVRWGSGWSVLSRVIGLVLRVTSRVHRVLSEALRSVANVLYLPFERRSHAHAYRLLFISRFVSVSAQ